MRLSAIVILILAALASAGCAGKRSGPDLPSPGATLKPGTAAKSRLIVTPEPHLVGTVAKVNERAGFVVINFPAGRLPATEVRMTLYRRGARVGQVKITGPQLQDDVIADLLSGQAQVGDEARE